MAIFLGLEDSSVHSKDRYGYNQCEEGYKVPNQVNPNSNELDDDCSWSILDMKFDSSWDWLMMLVNKIENFKTDKYIGFNMGSSKFSAGFMGILPGENDEGLIWEKVVRTGRKSNRFEAVYDAICKFIEWYDDDTGEISKIIEDKKKKGIID